MERNYNAVWPIKPQPGSIAELDLLIADREQQMGIRQIQPRGTIKIFIIMILFGLLFLIISYEWQAGFHFANFELIRHLLNEIAIAVLIAAILGWVFDWWLHKKAFDDIVSAAVGYLLPETVRAEMNWISELNIIYTNYHHKFEILPINDELVWLKESIRYDIVNKSDTPLNFQFTRSIDEWHHPGEKSKILLFAYRLDNKVSEYSESRLAKFIHDDGWALRFIYKGIKIKKDKPVTVSYETEQVRRKSDRENMIMTRLVENPQIEIVVPDSFLYDINVQHRKILDQIPPHNYRLNGTLLPYQGISFRWWPKNQTEINSIK